MSTDDQPALFDLPQGDDEERLDASALIAEWIKPRTPKKSVAMMEEAVQRALDGGAKARDIQFLLSRRHLFPSQAKFTVEELREAYRHLSRERVLAEHEGVAAKMLGPWGKRSTISQVALKNATFVVAAALAKGADQEDLKYALTHRTLLGSKKRLDEKMVQRALAQVPADRKAGHTAAEIFKNWYDRWYEGRYTQSPGQIVPQIKAALLTGIDEQKLASAMDHIGRAQQVVSAASIQYALQHVDKIAKNKQASGAHEDLVDESEFSMMDDVFVSDDYYGGDSPW